MRSNCLVFAVALFVRRRRSGKEGYLLFRRSRFVFFFHALYGERRADDHLRVVSFVPRNPRHKAVPPPLFSGKTHWGDL